MSSDIASLNLQDDDADFSVPITQGPPIDEPPRTQPPPAMQQTHAERHSGTTSFQPNNYLSQKQNNTGDVMMDSTPINELIEGQKKMLTGDLPGTISIEDSMQKVIAEYGQKPTNSPN